MCAFFRRLSVYVTVHRATYLVRYLDPGAKYSFSQSTHCRHSIASGPYFNPRFVSVRTAYGQAAQILRNAQSSFLLCCVSFALICHLTPLGCLAAVICWISFTAHRAVRRVRRDQEHGSGDGRREKRREVKDSMTKKMNYLSTARRESSRASRKTKGSDYTDRLTAPKQ
ncbi:hypothetical protein IWZ03DRAFT_187677 [Phyllosticta citriasiana]|uniref:Uncharacterized protein n=1 Tax=Phyllosticta citriasiana TaxID=595635 RepID=A0ABR1KJS2_9PEZI